MKSNEDFSSKMQLQKETHSLFSHEALYLMIPYSQRRGTVLPSSSYYLIETFNTSPSSVAWWWPWLSIQSWMLTISLQCETHTSTSPPPPPFLLYNSSSGANESFTSQPLLISQPLLTSQPPDVYCSTLKVFLLCPMSI